MDDQYREFAEDYPWLRPLEFLAGGTLIQRYADLLDKTGKSATILDCACGAGTDAIALAQAGYRVWASDGSGSMVAKARERAREAGVALSIEPASWDALAAVHGRRFDLVFCIGNSIVHAGGEQAMTTALAGMGSVMEPAGRLVVDSRNWDKHLAERPANQALPPIQLGDTRCRPIYLWDYGAAFEGPHAVTIVLLLERGESAEVRRHRLTFQGFSCDDLCRRLEAAGLCGVEREWSADESWYAVTARRP
jgi:SAM-dependent methyltransferase